MSDLSNVVAPDPSYYAPFQAMIDASLASVGEGGGLTQEAVQSLIDTSVEALPASVAVTEGLVVVSHGAVAATARPATAAAVYWIGSVEPTNAVNQDLFYDTSV